MTKAVWGGKGLFNLHFYIIVHHQRKSGQELSRAGAWRQKPMQRLWRNAAYWLTPHGLLILLSFTVRTPCLGVEPHTVGWALSHQSLIEKMPQIFAYRSV